MKIYKNAWFERFARKENIQDDTLRGVIHKIENGIVDADLGGGLLKQRIAGPGRGKAKGYRVIILIRKGDKAFFVYGFAKKDRANINKEEKELFKKMAGHVLSLSDSQISALVAKGQFKEIGSHDGKISK